MLSGYCFLNRLLGGSSDVLVSKSHRFIYRCLVSVSDHNVVTTIAGMFFFLFVYLNPP